ncbi:amidohydrolase family protein [Celeribacter sp. ULVN23_4]
MFIDTHLHLVNKNRIKYPWLMEAPALDKDWSYEDYELTAKRIGISGTLHMEVDCAEGDIEHENEVVAELMKRPNSLIRGAISSARPESSEFDAFLERMDTTVVKGIRRVLHVVSDDLHRAPLFRSNIRKIGAKGLPFDICMLERQLSDATDLVDACDNTVFILDHCGVPDIAGGDFSNWANAITRLAERPHVNVKISGLTAYTAPDWTLETLRPYVEHAINAFGWDRVVWGSDSPVCTLNSSLDQWMAITLALISGASESEQAALSHKNAKRIWRI